MLFLYYYKWVYYYISDKNNINYIRIRILQFFERICSICLFEFIVFLNYDPSYSD
jgi:hypothetical protein